MNLLLCRDQAVLVPSDGKVIIDNQNPYLMSHDNRAHFRASTIGFVFQQFYLIPYLNVMDNVLAPSLAFPQSVVKDRAKELINRFNLNDRIGHVPGKLSTGERQRTAMARAYLNNPKLILADEPVGNLDNENATIVLSALEEFARSGGAVLMVTHDDRSAKYAHRTLQLKNGKLT